MKVLIFFTCSLMFSLSVFFMTLTIKNMQDIKQKEYDGYSTFRFSTNEEKPRKYIFLKFLKFWNYL
nr:MAG TPA: hypothetical protein [Caudoviricetes sp.]